VRTRGWIHCISDQIGAAETFGVAYGHCIVSDQAAAIGVTAVPTPDSDRSSDLWMVYEEIMGRFIFISGVGVETAGHNQMRYYDSKAMRKVEEGQDIAIVAEAQAIVSSGQIKKAGRLLVKLH
jgi:hypothetical protein